jgi:hypothetical protein
MARPPKYSTEEDRNRAKREAYKRWADKNREVLLAKKREKSKEWRAKSENKEKKRENNRRYWETRGKFLERNRKPYSELTEEQKEKHREESKQYARDHIEENRERARQWSKEHPYETLSEEQKQKRRQQSKQWKLKHPEEHAAQQARGYLRHRDQRRRRAPGGFCELCGREETAFARRATGEIRALQQDHCHSTDVLRGLLCLDCNRLLGAARDNPGLLRSAAAYIEKYQPTQAATDLSQAFRETLRRVSNG